MNNYDILEPETLEQANQDINEAIKNDPSLVNGVYDLTDVVSKMDHDASTGKPKFFVDIIKRTLEVAINLGKDDELFYTNVSAIKGSDFYSELDQKDREKMDLIIAEAEQKLEEKNNKIVNFPVDYENGHSKAR